MAFTDRSHIAHEQPAPAGRATQLVAAVMLVALTVALVLRATLAPEMLAPAVATSMFGIAAATAGIAMMCRQQRYRHTWYDIAGMLTFIGIAITLLIEPDQIVRLVINAEQVD
jgi:O-antigen/teichoic acid export membrane protein